MSLKIKFLSKVSLGVLLSYGFGSQNAGSFANHGGR